MAKKKKSSKKDVASDLITKSQNKKQIENLLRKARNKRTALINYKIKKKELIS